VGVKTHRYLNPRRQASNHFFLLATCHYGMARPRVVDGGDGLQVCMVPANELNKKLRTADKGVSQIWGWSRGWQLLTYTEPRNWTYSLERPRRRKMGM